MNIIPVWTKLEQSVPLGGSVEGRSKDTPLHLRHYTNETYKDLIRRILGIRKDRLGL